jgi:antitoxin Phd
MPTSRRAAKVVTRRGIETAVLVPIVEWNRLQKAARPSLKDWLLAPEARFEDLIPGRHRALLRASPAKQLQAFLSSLGHNWSQFNSLSG